LGVTLKQQTMQWHMSACETYCSDFCVMHADNDTGCVQM